MTQFDYRVRETSKGFTIETKKPVWWGLGLIKKWVHISSYSGLPDQPFYFATIQRAVDGAINDIKEKILSDIT